ncbi:3-hydroxyisobutyrate dehydrogenase [Limosilactobacillus gastricus PS3]|uniref:3-hydroxyisobutyrate dehydrogenase n=1 Tax=Limosilactobacillus gastricus PS3 TaxID=1144300 RepID=H4GJY3_9LACO|nr:NAD(P)-dependent oxidoreductase [Limosilactobacillus gastricus]EHS86000.1 3-hydroxyisobutyrate dehydrogenase [Limosilactobacillus gastricus PS3]
MTKIGFIGTGLMGHGMIRNLLKNGYQVQIWNRTKTKAEDLINDGANWTDDAAQCAHDVDFIITIVGYPKDVEEVYFGEHGVLAGANPGTTIIDMTTTSPQLAQKIYQAAVDHKLLALDAPVSGGLAGAENGSLSIMVGGDQATFEHAFPVFTAMGKQIVLQGPAGAGQHTKMANQIALAGALAGVCESLRYAKAVGLDPQKMFDTIRAGAAGSAQMEAFMPMLINNDFKATFYMKHFIKDLKIAHNEANDRDLKLAILDQILKECQAVESMGFGDEGTQALYHWYE